MAAADHTTQSLSAEKEVLDAIRVTVAGLLCTASLLEEAGQVCCLAREARRSVPPLAVGRLLDSAVDDVTAAAHGLDVLAVRIAAGLEGAA